MNMDDFFINLFEPLGLFSTAGGLGDYLDGMDANGQLTRASIYTTIGLLFIITVVVAVLNYYYGVFNKVRFSHKLAWFLSMLVPSLIIAGIAYGYAAQSLQVKLPQGHFVSQNDCFGFAFATFLDCAILFIVLSLIIKWGSRNNSKVPF